MDRIFLDANVLYSAAHLENAGIGRLWELGNIELMSSAYAIEEARRNLALDRPSALPRLERLKSALTVTNPPQDVAVPAHLKLDPKDQPILAAAIHGKAAYLLTGDARHFEPLFGKRIEGVGVMRPAQYFAALRD